MIIHSVFFWLEESLGDSEKAEFEEGLKALFEIDCVAAGRFGKAAGTPEREVTNNTFDYSLFLEFESVEKHNEYQVHADHDVFVNQFSKWFKTVQVYDTEQIAAASSADEGRMSGEIRNVHGDFIDYAYHHGGSSASKLLVIGHGVTGNMDRPWAIALARAAAASGISALRFSFTGNGNSGGNFRDSNISKEVEDLGSVLDAVGDAGFKSVAYAGHSMGGAVGVLRAARDARIDYLISLAGMVHTKRFADEEFGDVTPDIGYMWDNPECPLAATFMSDLRQIDSVMGNSNKVNAPWLLVHGTEDDVVPFNESEEIIVSSTGVKEFVKIEGGDHVFSGGAEAQMTEAVVSWLKAQA